jgi:hypothetical protein
VGVPPFVRTTSSIKAISSTIIWRPVRCSSTLDRQEGSCSVFRVQPTQPQNKYQAMREIHWPPLPEHLGNAACSQHPSWQSKTNSRSQSPTDSACENQNPCCLDHAANRTCHLLNCKLFVRHGVGRTWRPNQEVEERGATQACKNSSRTRSTISRETITNLGRTLDDQSRSPQWKK